MRRMLYWLTGFLPCRIISDGERPYLERYFVCRLFGRNVYIHRFVASDPDRGLHDHPWSWALSIVLAGHYLEERRTGTRTVRWLNRITADTFHRVLKPEGAADVWTLFIHGARSKEWGFLRQEPNAPFLVWRPFAYPDCSNKPGRWWENAPRGRDCPSRQPRGAPEANLHLVDWEE